MNLYDLSVEEDELIVHCLEREIYSLNKRITETENDSDLNHWDAEKWCKIDGARIRECRALINRIGY
jgi:hypothetical protein